MLGVTVIRRQLDVLVLRLICHPCWRVRPQIARRAVFVLQ